MDIAALFNTHKSLQKNSVEIRMILRCHLGVGRLSSAHRQTPLIQFTAIFREH